MQKREITLHKVNGLNEAIKIEAVGEPGTGGANTLYLLTLLPESDDPEARQELPINYQEGPIKDVFMDANGFTTEAFLAIQIDRMMGFQYARLPDGSFDLNTPGKFACQENDEALNHLRLALEALQRRTKQRLARGVEGTLVK
jgi:hypothetical protein